MNTEGSEKQKTDKFAGGVNSVVEFFRECTVEFGKISWPQRKELVESTWVVLATIAIISVFILVCDQILSAVMQFLMKL